MINKTLQKRSPVGGNPFGSPNALSGKDLEYKYRSEDRFYTLGFQPYSEQKSPEVRLINCHHFLSA